MNKSALSYLHRRENFRLLFLKICPLAKKVIFSNFKNYEPICRETARYRVKRELLRRNQSNEQHCPAIKAISSEGDIPSESF